MSITRRLQLSMTALVTLGTLLLGLGQPSPTVPLVAMFAAVTSLVFTDILQWFRLNRVVANLGNLAAAVFSLWNFFRDNSQEQLLAIANLLSILLVILLYQHKNDRLYWQLAVLSLLQVVVAAALNLGLLFGILLVVYTLVAIGVLTVFFLARESNRACAAEAAALRQQGGAGPPGLASAVFGNAGHARPAAAFAAGPIAFQPVQGVFQRLPFTGGPLLWQIASICGTTLVFALILFYAVPRVGPAVWQGPLAAGQRQSGFSQQVTLDQMGEILQNPELVMRVSFTQLESGEPYEVESPFFRGAVLVDYQPDGQSARWNQMFPTSPRGGRLRSAAGISGLVREEIVFASSAASSDYAVEPPLLFSVYPFYPLADTPDALRYNSRSEQMFRQPAEEALLSGPFRYSLGTTGFRERSPSPLTPCERPLAPESRSTLTAFDKLRHARLAETARLVLATEGLPPRNRIQQARTLEGHFLDQWAIAPEGSNKAYSYSLRPSEERNRTFDPIEDFVAHHRTGHCEYFASALVMMLRSQNIPARLVVGYKGGEYNSVGNYWQVRQLNAHAWVEAYLEPEDVPAYALAPGESVSGGAWLRLDPTPASNENEPAPDADGLWGQITDVFDYAQFLWTDYVVGLNSETQKRTLYDPTAGSESASFSDLFDVTLWRKFFASGSKAAGLDPRKWFSGEQFSWRAGLVAVFLCLVVVGLFRLGSWTVRKLQRSRGRRKAAAAQRVSPRIDFYQALVAILARRGIERRPVETQREFAQAAESTLSQSPASRETASLPRFIVELFYRVRFGGATLDEEETQQVEQALTTLGRG